MKKYTIDFFLGANSCDGFQTFSNELTIPKKGNKSYLIKGGAGTGKSTFMRRVLIQCEKYFDFTERIFCSSDPNSFDGLLFNKGQISILDATLPHSIEPAYPGSFQHIINLCGFLDEKKLTPRLETIVKLQTKNNECHKNCCNLLKSASILLQANEKEMSAITNHEKVLEIAKKIAKKEFPKKLQSSPVEHKRLLSAITNIGNFCFEGTANALANKNYVIDDEYGNVSNEILQYLRQDLMEKGYEIYSCYCPLNPKTKLEHLFVPALSLGFVNKTSYRSFDDIKEPNIISARRFVDESLLQNKQKIKFHKKIALAILDDAVNELKIAKKIHDELENQYKDAVDFSKVNVLCDEIISDIFDCLCG
ncbi:MAG: hypothetical protein RSA79_00915 [Oscillospiraceae bacterium]